MKNKLLVLSLVSFIAINQDVNADTVDFLFGSGSFGRKASPIGDCRNIIQRFIENKKFTKDESWKKRVITERNKSFLNDKDLIDEIKYRDEKLGIVGSKFSKEFDTRFYFTATSKPDANGNIPMVDKEAKALVIYFHGSGTSKASGSNFAGKMNSLSKLGYSSLSFDLPFHAEGSRNPMLAQSKEFADYVDKIVQSVRVEGQPVILVGHSFGPDIMAEFITRHPYGADALVMLSPGGFDKVTSKWFADKTVNMTKIFGEVEANNDGGRWAGMVTNGRTWSNPKAPGRVDPTVANPKLKLYVVSGDKEEYIPGELDADGLPTSKPRDYDVSKAFHSYFKNVDVTIEPGVGHYIFAHSDAEGQDVVLRSILKANNESILEEKALKKAYSEKVQRSVVDMFAIKYSKDVFFKSFIDEQAALEKLAPEAFLAKMVSENDTKNAQNLMKIFDDLVRFRMEELNKHIKATENWAPDFFQANKEEIDALGSKGHDGTRVQSKYFTYIEQNSNLAEHYKVDKALLTAKEQELKKLLAEKANKNPVSILQARYAKETFLKEFIEEEASKLGKSADELIESIVSTSDAKQAQQLIRAFDMSKTK